MRALILLIIAAVMASASLAAEQKLECSIKTSCGPNEANVFNFEGVSHAELAAENSYPNKVCCHIGNGAVPLAASCGARYATEIIRLSDTKDAHAELPPLANYANRVCLGSNSRNVNIVCSYSGECSPSQVCIASVSSAEQGKTTDLHIAGCSPDLAQAYANKICCAGAEFSDSTFINGTVTKRENGARIGGANISFFMLHDLINPVLSAVSDISGFYRVDASIFAMKPNTSFRAVARYPGLSPSTYEKVDAVFDKTTAANFILGVYGGCQSDCTMENDKYRLCSAQCEGINGCSFPSAEVRNICTSPQQVKGSKKTLRENEENITYVSCCSDTPITKKKTKGGGADIRCGSGEELVKLTKIVLIDNEPVKMNVVTCKRK